MKSLALAFVAAAATALAGCAAAPAQPAQPDPCRQNEASYACQVERYNNVNVD